MALEGTHIRFALEVKDRFKVSDLSKYLAGTVYPDSRYVTGINRELTHPENFLKWDLDKIGDFQKGWFVHLIYDQIQTDVMLKKFTQLSELGFGPQGSEFWVRISALKNLQDIDDVQKLDVKPYLHFLDYVENPNGENIQDLQRYNKSVQELYLHPVDIASCVEFWRNLGQTEELSRKIKQASENYAQTPEVANKIPEIYPQTLKIFNKQFKNQ